jgi:putative endonuclease
MRVRQFIAAGLGDLKAMLGRMVSRRGAPPHSESADSGQWGEQVAELALKRKGYRVLGRRVRVGTRDEIDLVARDKNTLVFVEVKTRKGEDFGRPSGAVDRRKRQVLSRAAVRYLKELRDPRVFFRFDVVEVIGEPGDPDPVVRHIENAFGLDRRYSLPASRRRRLQAP